MKFSIRRRFEGWRRQLAGIGRKRLLLAISAVHALVLLPLTYMWSSFVWAVGDEIAVARMSQLVAVAAPSAIRYPVEETGDRFLFINCSFDKMLVPIEDPRGIGTKPISDRDKITAFLSALATAADSSRPKVVLLDIIFTNPSEYDSALQTAITRVPETVISTILNDSGGMVQPLFRAVIAPAVYATGGGGFVKMPVVVGDTLRSMGAFLYEKLHGARFDAHDGIVTDEKGSLWLRSFIMNFRLRQRHLEAEEGGVPHVNLGELLMLPPEEIIRMCAGRIVILCDLYDYDQHETLLGEMPGCFLIANAYLAMLAGEGRIRLWIVLTLFILYAAVSYQVFRGIPLSELRMMQRLFRWRIGKIVIKYLSYLLLFGLVSIIVFLISGFQLQIVVFALYFNLVEYIVLKIRSRRALQAR